MKDLLKKAGTIALIVTAGFIGGCARYHYGVAPFEHSIENSKGHLIYPLVSINDQNVTKIWYEDTNDSIKKPYQDAPHVIFRYKDSDDSIKKHEEDYSSRVDSEDRMLTEEEVKKLEKFEKKRDNWWVKQYKKHNRVPYY